jgi:hypothetical protein
MVENNKQIISSPYWAITCTAGWVLIIVLMAGYNLWGSPNTVKLNELGDFVGGAMSPVAVFWLVMVYLQQRKEMREQVQQTENIAKETQRQVSLMDEQFMKQYEPLFVCQVVEFRNGDKFLPRIIVDNIGGTAIKLWGKPFGRDEKEFFFGTYDVRIIE